VTGSTKIDLLKVEIPETEKVADSPPLLTVERLLLWKFMLYKFGTTFPIRADDLTTSIIMAVN
jgi:hypothetical protein